MTAGEGGHARAPFAFASAVAAIVAAAVLLRLHQLDAQGIWIDEANSILTAHHGVGAILERLRLDSSPPLFYLLLHFWIAVVGDGSAALRSLSVLASAALVALSAWGGRAVGGTTAGITAAVFVAASPVQVHYSQQVRMYTLLPLLALASTLLLVRYLRDGERRAFVFWLAATLLALYTHNFAVHLLVVHATLILASGRAIPWWKSWFAGMGIGAIGYAPWLPTALEQIENGDHYQWFAPYWEQWGVWGSVGRTLLSWSPGGEYLMFAGPPELSHFWQGLPTLCACLLAAFGVWKCWGSARRERERAARLWPLALTVVPLASALLVSVLATPHYVPSRVDQMMLPGFAILVGLGVAALPAVRALRVAVVLAIAAVGCTSALWLHAEHGTRGYVIVDGVRKDFEVSGSERELAGEISARFREGDVVVFTSLFRAPVEYYLRRAGIEGPFLSFPADTADHLGSQNDARWLVQPAELRQEALRVMQQARRLVAGGSRASQPVSPESGRIFLVRGLAEIDTYLGTRPLEGMGVLEREALGYYEQVGVSAVARLVICEPRERAATR